MTDLPLLGAAEFPGDIEHVTEARHWVRKVLGNDHAAVDLVELLACELITNSAKHTKTDKVRIAVYGSDDIARVFEDGEWERLDQAWHDSYHRLMDSCGLAVDARPTIDALTAAGHTQSLLSMWRHERLVPTVARLGLAPAFRRVDGLRPEQADRAGGQKAGYLVRHLGTLGIEARDVIMIGDSADDALAARQAGARAVLYAGGMQGRADLERLGVPVVDRLADFVAHV